MIICIRFLGDQVDWKQIK